MFRPTERGFSPNEPLHSNLTEGQCGFDTSSVKHLHQTQSDAGDISGTAQQMHIPHGALPSESFSLTDVQLSSSRIIELENDISFHEYAEWPSILGNDLSSQLPAIFSLHNSVTFDRESSIAGPMLSCTQAPASYSGLPTTNNYTEADELVLHQRYVNDALQPGSNYVHQAGTFAQTGDHFQTSVDMSWMNDASLDSWGNHDWVTGDSSQAPALSFLPDGPYSTNSRFDNSMSDSGNFLMLRNCMNSPTETHRATESSTTLNFQEKPYREILPLLRERLAADPWEEKSTSNIAKSSQRYKNKKNLNSKGRPKLGRSKSFAPERASAIAEMRIMRACLRCRIKKVGCSPGEVCDACLAFAFGLERTLCVRNNIDHSTELLFPPIVNSNFHKSNIENLIYENIESFSGNKISVQISSGPTYPPISLWVEEFRPTNDDFLILPHVKMDKDGRIESRLMRGYTPPLALPPHAGKSLRKKCQEHVDLIAKGQRSEGEFYYKHTSIVPWEVFNAIEKYHRSSKDELVGKSIVLFAMHFFMTQILLFTEDSADSALRSLNHPAKLPYKRSLTSRLISLQIKEEMYDLAHIATKEVLKLLEDTMIGGSKNRKLWISSFCTILILCMCTETVQIATDFKIVHSIIEGERSQDSRSESKEQCQRLEEYVISTLEAMFHRVFKSRKKPGSRKHERGFNPIRDGIDLSGTQGLDTAGVRLVSEIRSIIAEKEKEIGIRLATPSFDTNPNDLSDLLARHLVFREKNSGRLVSRFLRSFFISE